MKKIWLKIMSWFGIGTDFLKKHEATAHAAVEAVNIFKDQVVTGVANMAALSPSSKDDAIVMKVKDVLVNKVIPEMVESANIVSSTQTNTSAYQALLSHLAAMPKLGRVKWWLEMAGKIIEALADGEFTLGEAVSLGQAIFSKLFGK